MEEKERAGKARTYPKTPRTIYHAQRAQQEVRLGMLMWAAGAGSQCACATPRGANHRPRNGSCARSQLVEHHNLGKMEEESLGCNSNFSLFLLLLRPSLCSVLFPFSLSLSLSLSFSPFPVYPALPVLANEDIVDHDFKKFEEKYIEG